MIVPSRAMAKQVTEIFDPTRIDHVHLAVQQGPGTSSSHDGPFLMMGRVSPQKEQELAIRAVALLRCGGLQVPLDIVGECGSEYASRMVALSQSLSVDSLVRFRGPTKRPLDWFKDCRAAIVCSIESFGRVTVEAMKAGAPVIGADVGGTSELIDHGRTGLKFEPNNVDALARCMSNILSNPQRARTMGEEAQRWACSEYTENRFRDELLASFTKVTSKA
jgi:glycosyltransferase involved in cell wall biosynthesis